MNRISIYVRNKDITPSSYYRVIQYANYFRQQTKIRNIAPTKIYNLHLNSNKDNFCSKPIGVLYYLTMLLRVTWYVIVDIINPPDYVILSKTFIPKYCPIFLIKLLDRLTNKTKFIWDFDDNIFESKEISMKQANILSKNSYKIITTSNFLKRNINQKYWHKVVLLPTTDGDLFPSDFKVIHELRKTTYTEEVKLVWVATSGNIPHLLDVIDILDLVANELKDKYNKQLIMNVVCNKNVDVNTKYLKINNIIWSRKIAKEELFKAHIGIMPLIENEYTLGKGGFKLVQYLSVGLPVIASNVGFNSEVVNKNCGYLIKKENKSSEWINAIIELSTDWGKWLEYSGEAVERWKNNFSFNKNLEQWEEFLKS